MAAYIACFTSISLGYSIALSKSSLLPGTALMFATRLGRLSFCHLISVPSFLLQGSPFWSMRQFRSRIFRSVLEKPYLLPCWFLLPSCTPVLSSKPSPAPLCWPPCSFALRPNLGKNFCIGGFLILGRGASLGRASAVFSFACIRMLPTPDEVVALSSRVSPLRKPAASGMWSPAPYLLQSRNLWLFLAPWRV